MLLALLDYIDSNPIGFILFATTLIIGFAIAIDTLPAVVSDWNYAYKVRKAKALEEASLEKVRQARLEAWKARQAMVEEVVVAPRAEKTHVGAHRKVKV